MQTIKNLNKKVVLCILDGFGMAKPGAKDLKNAILHAKKPNLDRIFASYPWTTIEPGGELVGLPKGVVGNSEVGHMNLGAGRPVRQDLVRINEAIEKNALSSMPELQNLIQTAKKKTKRIHLMGLLSDGGVHSHISHFKAIIDILRKEPDLKIFFHAFMDGRDTAPDVGEKYLNDILGHGGFTFASMQGRSIGMDRDRRWEKIKLAYDTFIGHGETTTVDPVTYLRSEYKEKRFDEFVKPVLFNKSSAIQNDDCIFFMNFRPDRAIQLALTFNWDKFQEFKIDVKPAFYLCMTPYVPDEVTLPILFDKERIPMPLSQYLSSLNLKQFKIAETEKYAHVTYFFNGGEKKPFSGEEHVLIPSPKEVPTYDCKPQMSAPLVAARLIEAINQKGYDFLLVNFANADMVGHTGKYEAALKAVEALDECVGKVAEACKNAGYTLLLTADHGNADQMVYEDGTPHTSHTGAAVPFVVIDAKLENVKVATLKKDPALMDVGPTVLTIMGIPYPSLFQGQAIFV